MKKYLLKKHILFVFIGLGLFLYVCPVFSSEMDLHSTLKLDWIIKNIKEKEKNLKTFTARMVQTKKTHLLRDPMRSEGLIYFDYTGKILMKITIPLPLTILLKENVLLLYYPDLSKAEERYLGNNIFNKYLGIGQSVDELHERYSIRLVSDTPSEEYHLKLIPKLKTIANYISSIEITVSPENWLPKRIYLEERGGDYTDIWLEFISINEPLPAGIFAVSFPKNHEDL